MPVAQCAREALDELASDRLPQRNEGFSLQILYFYFSNIHSFGPLYRSDDYQNCVGNFQSSQDGANGAILINRSRNSLFLQAPICALSISNRTELIQSRDHRQSLGLR